jgi:hypothetical protein
MSDLCSICGRSVGSEHPGAEVSHMACAMERAYGLRGKDPAESANIVTVMAYKHACEMRAGQVG